LLKWIEDAVVNPQVISIIRGPPNHAPRLTKPKATGHGEGPKEPAKEAPTKPLPLDESELNLNYTQALKVARVIMNVNQISLQLDEENVKKAFLTFSESQKVGQSDLIKTIKLDTKSKFSQFLS
jgi:hypothetical protein